MKTIQNASVFITDRPKVELQTIRDSYKSRRWNMKKGVSATKVHETPDNFVIKYG
jgi:hypothetical protein